MTALKNIPNASAKPTPKKQLRQEADALCARLSYKLKWLEPEQLHNLHRINIALINAIRRADRRWGMTDGKSPLQTPPKPAQMAQEACISTAATAVTCCNVRLFVDENHQVFVNIGYLAEVLMIDNPIGRFLPEAVRLIRMEGQCHDAYLYAPSVAVFVEGYDAALQGVDVGMACHGRFLRGLKRSPSPTPTANALRVKPFNH